MTQEEVIADVDQFVQENGFQEQRDLLVKGALIAKDPAEFESVPGITEEEIKVIRNEVLHRWWQPWRLYFTIVLCSVGAATQGWDQTGSNAANLSFPAQLGIPDTSGPNAELNSWIVGIVNAGPYIGASIMFVPLPYILDLLLTTFQRLLDDRPSKLPLWPTWHYLRFRHLLLYFPIWWCCLTNL